MLVSLSMSSWPNFLAVMLLGNTMQIAKDNGMSNGGVRAVNCCLLHCLCSCRGCLIDIVAVSTLHNAVLMHEAAHQYSQAHQHSHAAMTWSPTLPDPGTVRYPTLWASGCDY